MERSRKVCFIPSPADNPAVTSPPTSRNNPFVLLWQDLVTLFSMIYLLPKLLRPFLTNKPSDELFISGQNIFYLSLLAFVTLLEGIFIVILLLGLPIFSGIATFAFVSLGYGIVYGLCAPTRGPLVIESRSDILPDGEAERWKEEKWVFINGTFVTNHGLQKNCDRITRTFGRPVTGLHNPTLGLFGDIVECIIQRSFSYNTYCTRYSYDYVKARLADPKIRKVVLIGHSQGAIIVNMVLDLLFTDMPVENIAKLEVYTFGCAASHFNNPLRAVDPGTQKSRTGVIPYMEHYANSDDIVTRWGVLYNACKIPSNSFMGKVFVRRYATGHLLNQHYLSTMFPLPGEESSSEDGYNFLDEVVDVHERLTCRRQYSPRRNGHSFGQRSITLPGSPEKSEDVERLDNIAISQIEQKAGLDALHFVINGAQMSGGREACRAGDTKANGPEAAARSVRELSRLWRYMGGMDPDRRLLEPVDDEYDAKDLMN